LVAKSSAGRKTIQSKKRFETIDKYIETFPKDVQSILEKMRQTIRKAAPEAEETISYQMPTFKLKGSVLVYFAAFRRHIGLFPPAPREFKKEVSSYEGPKGNLKFPTDKPMPYDLVTRIVLFRKKAIQENKK
jgi:uncharacterized protein YdhG (YjbR/CyaY superfamily)